MGEAAEAETGVVVVVEMVVAEEEGEAELVYSQYAAYVGYEVLSTVM